ETDTPTPSNPGLEALKEALRRHPPPPQPAPPRNPMMDLRRRNVTFQAKDVPLDDYIIAVANTGDVNIIADATEFGPNAPRLSDEWKQTFDGLFRRLTYKAHLSWMIYNDRVFLMWKEPDIIALAKRIVDGEADAQLSIPKPPDIAPGLQRYLTEIGLNLGAVTEQTRGLPVVLGSPEIHIAFKDLPPALQQDIAARVTRATIDASHSHKAWFDDKFWNAALLGMRHERGATPARYLIIGNMLQQTHTSGPMISTGYDIEGYY
ncbi:MAG: hypothetical protein JWN98_394, partial [Abditibacteriota bacterium]|nr:hypothetical protein [Abditibacteriota bacterium]